MPGRRRRAPGLITFEQPGTNHHGWLRGGVRDQPIFSSHVHLNFLYFFFLISVVILLLVAITCLFSHNILPAHTHFYAMRFSIETKFCLFIYFNLCSHLNSKQTNKKVQTQWPPHHQGGSSRVDTPVCKYCYLRDFFLSQLLKQIEEDDDNNGHTSL